MEFEQINMINIIYFITYSLFMYSSQINPTYDDVSPIQKQQAPMLIWKKSLYVDHVYTCT